MVGVGPRGKESALAKVSIVDYDGKVLLDKLVKPMEMVVDYRTNITGIHSGDLDSGRKYLVFCQRISVFHVPHSL